MVRLQPTSTSVSHPASSTPPAYDWLTLIALSALAYICSTFLHEHLGHTAACYALGSRATEIGAYYSSCDYTGMGDWGPRLVALAGPVISIVVFGICLLIVRRRPVRASITTYFTWLLGTVSGMGGSGYLMFSGIGGIGDLGFTRDGLLYGATPVLLWRIVLSVVGIAAYYGVVVASARAFDAFLGGSGRFKRVRYARHLALVSYLTGSLVSVAIGLLNPEGWVIVLSSAAASTFGGSSGLLWMMQLLKLNEENTQPWFAIERSWGWIVGGIVVTVVYAAFFGPTIRP